MYCCRIVQVLKKMGNLIFIRFCCTAIKPDATEPMTLADIYNEEPNGQAQSKAIGFQS